MIILISNKVMLLYKLPVEESDWFKLAVDLIRD